MTLEAIRCALLGVSAYRGLLEEPLIGEVSGLLDALAHKRGTDAVEWYAKVFYRLRQEGYDGLGSWFWDKLRYVESPYPRLLECKMTDPALESAARRDIETFTCISTLDCDALIEQMKALLSADFAAVLATLPRWRAEAGFDFNRLTEFYKANGAGLFARYRAFLWEGGVLRGVPDPDCMESDELIGFERQRGQVVANTRAMLKGESVNNVLLYGEPGTGKSVTVKSLLAEPGFHDLRLIEVQKEELADLHALISTLVGRRQKFILFIDDLAFDQDDRTYSVLKTILEGGLERRPANVAVYATSNRRNLVRQTFSDREGDEVDKYETIAEKTSLAERFGLRIPYLALDKEAFLSMVERMAAQYGIALETEELRAMAVKFEARHPGRTPRTARQFITSLSM